MGGCILWLVADRIKVFPYARAQLREELSEFHNSGTLCVVGGNTYGEVEPGEYGSGFPCFIPEVLEKHRQFADRRRCRSGVAPVRAEGSLSTPTLRWLAAPVSVVNKSGFIHVEIVIVFGSEIWSILLYIR
jgi:hypothetical protein